jgi:glutamate-1-semialdehyde aminotransferase
MQNRDFSRSLQLYERSREVIPGGVPGIRAPENFVAGAYPVFLAGGDGAWITDVDGNRYLDMLLGYGPMILGHADPGVDRAAWARQEQGFCLNLPQPELVELAERLVEMVPSAEQALFFKTGSDATSAAVRIARTHTGREKILRCGYHGWNDWCLPDDPGVPYAVTESVLAFEYNAPDQLEELLRQHAGRVAAIVITPVGHEFDAQIEPPVPGFLEAVRRLADEHAAVLVFDEVRTGFRLSPGGAQQLYGVTPDLTALGKAMSNGYPVSALVGSRRVMASACDTFISSTYFPNGLSMAAALATTARLRDGGVISQLDDVGGRLQRRLQAFIAEADLPVTLSPYPSMPFLYFDRSLAAGQDARRDRFYAALCAQGVFAHPRHHGFLSACHGDTEIDCLIAALQAAAHAISQ